MTMSFIKHQPPDLDYRCFLIQALPSFVSTQKAHNWTDILLCHTIYTSSHINTHRSPYIRPGGYLHRASQ